VLSESEGDMYSYAQVEAALASNLNVRAESMGALRGRLKHFQKLGLVTAAPGKGKKIEYIFSDVWLWAVTLELCEFGIDTTKMKNIVKPLSDNMLSRLTNDTSNNEDLFEVFYPRFVSRWFETDGNVLGDIETETITASDLLSDIRDDRGQRRRRSVLNISQLERELKAALDDAVTSHPRRGAGAA
jgi:hypothetical protein